MKLSAPKQVTWWIAVVIGVLGIAGTWLPIPFIPQFATLLLVVAFVLLILATLLKQL